MVAVLDTNIVVDYLRDFSNTVVEVEKYDEIYLPITVCGELLFGAEISGNPSRHREKIMDFIGRTHVLLTDMPVVEKYAEIRKHLQTKGRPIPENDIWIAAAAHANGLKLVTRDRHFSQIDFLAVEFWQ